MQIDLNQLVDEFAAHHSKHAAAGATHARSSAEVKAGLKDVVNQLKAKGFNWLQILTVLGPIIAQLFSGTPIGAIIAAVLAILNPTPTPAPVPTP